MKRSRWLICAALVATFVTAMAIGMLWPRAAQAAPLCEWCESGEMRCISSCNTTYPNDPIARSQCIEDCFDHWDWCYSVCV